MSKREPVTEADVKTLVKEWFEQKGAFAWAPVSNGMGIHGVHDRIGVVPIRVTPQMVGKIVGVMVTVEAKRPGRRGEKNRGMSANQVNFMVEILGHGGLSACCDGAFDLQQLTEQLVDLQCEPAQNRGH